MQRGTKVRLPRRALPHLRASDPAMEQVIADVGRFGMRHGQAHDDLEALVRSIVYQQLSGKAAATIYGRFRALFGDVFPEPAELLGTHHMRLRKVGLSRNKQLAVKDLCRHAMSGRLPLGDLGHLEDDPLIERLTAVRGIGEWSAQMFLMFHLGRIDVWPVGDLGIRKGVQRLRGLGDLPDRKTMERVGQDFAPFRSVAAWYLWRSLDAEAQI